MDLDRFGRRMIELLPQLVRGIARHEHNSLSRGEITLPQLWALEHLARRAGGSPMQELARALGISKPAATGLIDRLIAQQCVHRGRDSQDRRVVRAAITPKGRRLLAGIWEQKRRAITSVFGHVSPSDRAQYLAILERVVASLAAQQRSRSP